MSMFAFRRRSRALLSGRDISLRRVAEGLWFAVQLTGYTAAVVVAVSETLSSTPTPLGVGDVLVYTIVAWIVLGGATGAFIGHR
ncbi:hypothetical protein [Nocardia puris]|uniref:hypothetical protein n=1 Tax=Nocardia puris TaxID=208602 RepID=UPI002E1F52F6